MLTFRQMTIFRAVMETSTLTEAARTMTLSQPGVSKCIRDIESLLGFPLFRRQSGRLTPTKEARALYGNVLVALRAMDSVSRAAENYRDTRSGYVRIAATATLAHSLIPMAIYEFKRRRTAAQVVLYTGLNHEVVRMVADLEADFGLVLMPTNHAGTEGRDLCAAHLKVVMPAGHPLCALDAVGPKDLMGYPLVSYSRDQPIGLEVDEQFRQAGIARHIAIEIIQSATACSVVAAGAGVAIVDGYALINGAFPNLEVRPFCPSVDVVSRLLMPPAQEPTRLATAFLNILDETVAAAAQKGLVMSGM
jgi:DNA-binding transcriptional LysR family regulator